MVADILVSPSKTQDRIRTFAGSGRIDHAWHRILISILCVVCGILSLLLPIALQAQELIELTLESTVDIAVKNSYRINQLKLGIERNRYRLKAERAALKSSVHMNLKVPEFNAVSDYRWNSGLSRDEIVRQNTRLWQMDLSIEQPILLFGYPTNGYLSLNNQVHRYLQKSDEDEDVDYYNRYFVRFEQPLFRPNELKNDIEEAELELEENELEYLVDKAELIEGIAYHYYYLFELSYRNLIYAQQLANLQSILELTRVLCQQDSARRIDQVQVEIELSNTRGKLLESQSEMRLEMARMKQRLRLSERDSVYVVPTVKITPIKVDVDQAIDYGHNLRPRMRLLAIHKREHEIDLHNTRGENAFHIDLEMTYGLEKQEGRYRRMWDEYDNSYSVSVNTYIPIWDWGRRKALIEAERISLRKVEMDIEENTEEIRAEIANAITSLEEYQKRALDMQKNLELTQQISDVSITQYAEGKLSLQDVLQIVNRQRETGERFLDAYLGYRRSLLSLTVNTYYDYENGVPLVDRFRSDQ